MTMINDNVTINSALVAKDEEISHLKSKAEMFRTMAEDYEHDFKLVAGRLLEEAIERDWCESYDIFVDDVNSNLRRLTLTRATRTYKVTFIVTRTQDTTVSTKVEARDADEAEDIARTDYKESDLLDTIKEEEWDTQDIELNYCEVEDA